MMVTINSGSNPQIKEIVKLQKSARERKKKQMFVVEGYRLAGEAASSGRLRKLYLSESAVAECRAGEHWDTLGQYPHEVVADVVFRGMSDTVTPQGILGLAEMPCYSLDDILQDRRRSILLLDDIRDPGNLGTIMRTAEGADMSGIILSRESVDLFNPKVVRSTMGAIFRVPFYFSCFFKRSQCIFRIHLAAASMSPYFHGMLVPFLLTSSVFVQKSLHYPSDCYRFPACQLEIILIAPIDHREEIADLISQPFSKETV